MNLQDEIKTLKTKSDAIILAHNYQRPEIQDIADFVGDSLELSLQAKICKETTIVFCGVRFMAETAKLLSPQKTVLLPESSAGCPLADMMNHHAYQNWRNQYPDLPLVTYINSSIEIKAQTDICCTSANALKIIESIESDTVLFGPDKCLGSWLQEKSLKKLILFPGFCPTHQLILKEDIITARQRYPEGVIMVHPESPKEIRDLCDLTLGTGGMLRAAKTMPTTHFIIGTEEGMVYRLKHEIPTKLFTPLNGKLYCSNMKKTTLESVKRALLEKDESIEIPKIYQEKALLSIKRMLENS